MNRPIKMRPAGTGAGGWHGVTINGDLHSCWLCQRPVGPQALRCTACGALQPLHDPNHFALLGLEERFDLALDDLDRHYATARRTLDPERVAIKNPKAGELAHRYTEMMALAYETLHNPVSRARYLLGLLDAEAVAKGQEPTDPAVAVTSSRPDLDELAAGIETATDCPTVDRLGAQAMREIEHCIHTLATAFRAGRLDEARLTLAGLDRLEAISALARRRRRALCPPPTP